jgi:hypothetical protein
MAWLWLRGEVTGRGRGERGQIDTWETGNGIEEINPYLEGADS